jgi:hypothetical protein
LAGRLKQMGARAQIAGGFHFLAQLMGLGPAIFGIHVKPTVSPSMSKGCRDRIFFRAVEQLINDLQ